MRHIFIALLLAVFFKASANDTLTRAQVYNFSVGDTFDYRNYTYVHWRNSAFFTTSTTYSRYLVTNISYSLDSTTKYIQQERLFPLPDSITILALSNLLGYEVLLDTAYPCYPPTISVAPTSQFHGRSIDTLFQFFCPSEDEVFVFADGLGTVVDSLYYGPCGMCATVSIYSTTLIYYAKGNEIWGTPYTSFPTPINDLSASSQKINVFPTINSGVFTVETPDEMPLPVNFSVYDVQGKKVKQLTLSDKRTNVEVHGASRGLYVWKAYSSEKFIGAGKVIVE